MKNKSKAQRWLAFLRRLLNNSDDGDLSLPLTESQNADDAFYPVGFEAETNLNDARLREERFYEALLLNSPVAIVSVDLGGQVVSCNPAFERLFGYSPEEVIGKNLDSLVSSQDNYFEALDYTRRVVRLGETIRTTGRRQRSDGAHLDVEIQAVPILVEGEKIGVLTLYHDITDRRRAEEALRSFYRSFIHIMDSIDADVYVADLENYEILFMNRHMRDSFGGDLVGQICWKVFRKEEGPCSICTNPLLLDDRGEPTGVHVWEGQNPITGRWYKNSDRAIRWGDGRYVRLQIATDITELKEAEKRLEHLATHDALTDLPNRLLFQDRLAHALEIAGRNQSYLAVLFLDLDQFKEVNDRWGHRVGDLLLKSAAGRMRACLRACDTIARVSGDEFTFLLENLPDTEGVMGVAEKILETVSRPYNLAGHEVSITASIGISIYPSDGELADELLRQADEALYAVKKHGKNGIRRYHELHRIRPVLDK